MRTLPEKDSQEDKWDMWSLDYTLPIPAQYESPDALFMEHIKPSHVLERLEHGWMKSKLSA